jgi:hypothetical protein
MMNALDISDTTQEPSSNTHYAGSPAFSNGRNSPDRVLVKELNENDVLQGRGSGSMQNTGNIRFRSLVEKLRPAYVATSSRKEKAKMISDMVQLIQSRKGRFLQRLCDKEVEELGLGPVTGDHYREQEHYVEMSDDEAAEKAKQAIRYVHYKKVPLEEERRKKRAADNYFNDKTNSESTRRIDYGGNRMSSSTNIANQLTQSQVPQSNVRAGATIPPQLQQTDISQLLATLQTTQTALANQLSGNIYTTSHTQVHQSSINRDSAQRASVIQQLTGGSIPMVGNVQQQPNTLQLLASSLFSNSNSALPPNVSHAPSTLLDTTGNQNASQQQLPQLQAQLDTLLQSLLQQQSSQPNLILQTILQQQQLDSALQALQNQQQHQLTSTIQSLQQTQQLNSDPQFQQRVQQQNTNSILQSLLSNANTNSQAGSTLGPLTSHPAPNMNYTTTAQPQPTMTASNALLTSLLSNNNPQRSAFQQTGNSHAQGISKSGQFLGGFHSSMNMSGTNGIVNTTGQHHQHNQGLFGASALQGIPGLAQNVKTLLAANANNNTQGQTIMTATNRNTAKRPRLSFDNTTEYPAWIIEGTILMVEAL